MLSKVDLSTFIMGVAFDNNEDSKEIFNHDNKALELKIIGY